MGAKGHGSRPVKKCIDRFPGVNTMMKRKNVRNTYVLKGGQTDTKF